MHQSTSTGLLASVRAGFGAAVLPCFVADSDPDLLRCLPPLRGDAPHLWLLTHERLRHAPRIRAVLDFAGARLLQIARSTPRMKTAPITCRVQPDSDAGRGYERSFADTLADCTPCPHPV